MLGIKTQTRRASREEAEKPFWISYSDLMTALMVLFLVAMAAVLLAVTRNITNAQTKEDGRTRSIESCMANVRAYTDTIHGGIQVRDYSVDFGSLAKFPNNSSYLDPVQQDFLRRFVPQVLVIARKPVCQDWLKQIVVEGYASPSGSYLHNLNLSTQRSERVLCALLGGTTGRRLAAADRELIQDLFIVGGYSYNSTKRNDDESRRIELKLVFYALREPQDAMKQRTAIMSSLPEIPSGGNVCAIDAR